MIFVVVGTQKFPLDRLLRALDELAARGDWKEEILAQTGHSSYRPKHYPAVDFLPREEFEAAVSRCDLLLTHAGIGTVMTGLRMGKPVIVFPRLARYHEHVDDHQREIARSFAEMGYVMLCEDAGALGRTIEASRSHAFRPYLQQPNEMVEQICGFLDRI